MKPDSCQGNPTKPDPCQGPPHKARFLPSCRESRSVREPPAVFPLGVASSETNALGEGRFGGNLRR